MKTKDVALVLSSGGPRGFAYIGAIEELERRGYEITSVAGSSIGSLVGGIYASGGLNAFKEWLFDLDNLRLMSLLDVSISMNSVLKGDKVIAAIKQVVPDVNIEDLRIPYTAIAADLFTGEEIIFREGRLFDAVRASISIPSMFRPVKHGHRTLVDGGVVNTFPLNRVHRNGHDILIGFNVNQINAESINRYLLAMDAERSASEQIAQASIMGIDAVRANGNLPFTEKLKQIRDHGSRYLMARLFNEEEKRLIEDGERNKIPVDADDNYYSVLTRTFSVMNHALARLAVEANRPDILVEMSLDEYGDIMDYAKGEEIAELGRRLMSEALDDYEKTGQE